MWLLQSYELYFLASLSFTFGVFGPSCNKSFFAKMPKWSMIVFILPYIIIIPLGLYNYIHIINLKAFSATDVKTLSAIYMGVFASLLYGYSAVLVGILCYIDRKNPKNKPVGVIKFMCSTMLITFSHILLFKTLVNILLFKSSIFIFILTCGITGVIFILACIVTYFIYHNSEYAKGDKYET